MAWFILQTVLLLLVYFKNQQNGVVKNSKPRHQKPHQVNHKANQFVNLILFILKSEIPLMILLKQELIKE